MKNKNKSMCNSVYTTVYFYDHKTINGFLVPSVDPSTSLHIKYSEKNGEVIIENEEILHIHQRGYPINLKKELLYVKVSPIKSINLQHFFTKVVNVITTENLVHTGLFCGLTKTHVLLRNKVGLIFVHLKKIADFEEFTEKDTNDWNVMKQLHTMEESMDISPENLQYIEEMPKISSLVDMENVSESQNDLVFSGELNISTHVSSNSHNENIHVEGIYGTSSLIDKENVSVSQNDLVFSDDLNISTHVSSNLHNENIHIEEIREISFLVNKGNLSESQNDLIFSDELNNSTHVSSNSHNENIHIYSKLLVGTERMNLMGSFGEFNPYARTGDLGLSNVSVLRGFSAVGFSTKYISLTECIDFQKVFNVKATGPAVASNTYFEILPIERHSSSCLRKLVGIVTYRVNLEVEGKDESGHFVKSCLTKEFSIKYTFTKDCSISDPSFYLTPPPLLFFFISPLCFGGCPCVRLVAIGFAQATAYVCRNVIVKAGTIGEELIEEKDVEEDFKYMVEFRNDELALVDGEYEVAEGFVTIVDGVLFFESREDLEGFGEEDFEYEEDFNYDEQEIETVHEEIENPNDVL